MRHIPLCAQHPVYKVVSHQKGEEGTRHRASAGQSFPSSLQSPVKAGFLATRSLYTTAEERRKGWARSSSGWGAAANDAPVLHAPLLQRNGIMFPFINGHCAQHHARDTYGDIIFPTTLWGKHHNSIFQRQKLSQKGQFPGPNTVSEQQGQDPKGHAPP